MCNAELAAAGRSAEGCPYLQTWLAHYEAQSAAHIVRTITLYTGGSAPTAAGLIDAVSDRVRVAVRTWVASGRVTGIPPTLPLPTGSDPAVQVQRKSTQPDAEPPATGLRALQSGLGSGHPLDSGLRGRMEHGFGRGFQHVRVHSDARAGRLASGLSARAFTIGQDVVFGPGEYRPGTIGGEALVAHELAHTVQQGTPDVTDAPVRLSADGALEHEADEAAAGALGLPVTGHLSSRRGLSLQGCSQKTKACPVGYQWFPTATVQWGSLGCTCMWRCLKEPPEAKSESSGPAYTCPADQYCGDPYDRVDLETYTKTGYGAAFTPLTGEPACGCFPLDIEGKQVTGAPLMPVTLDMTAVLGPGAEMAAGYKARKEGRSSGGTRTDPRTGVRSPGYVHEIANPLRARAIEGGLYTAENTARLDRLFTSPDPATMAAVERTLEMPAGVERTDRLNRLLEWSENRPATPKTVEEGSTFGKGGTGSVAEVKGRPDLASKTGAGRAPSEAQAMVELELVGIPTVYLAEAETAQGSNRLVLRRIDGVGSKETIGRPGTPPDPAVARENAKYVTPRTISDLDGIYQKLTDAKMNVGDFQFIIRKSDGAVFVNDPTGFTPNSKPSGDIKNIIDQFRRILRLKNEGQLP
jgi:hypothetical protein